MRRKKKTTIVTFESRERLTIHRHQQRFIAWCEWCGEEVLMVTPNEAASLGHSDTRAIFRRVEAGEIHFLETANGSVFICANSLKQELAK